MWWDALKARRRAQAVAAARRPRAIRSSRAAPCGSTPCTAGSTTTSTASTTASRPSRAVTIEDEKDVWGNYADWPIPGTQNVDVFLRSAGQATAGNLGGRPAAARRTRWRSRPTASSENTLMNNPTGSQANRRVFLSNPLNERRPPVRHRDRRPRAPRSAAGAANLSVMIVDYGAGTQVSRTSDGVDAGTTTASCWGVGTAGDPCEGKALGDGVHAEPTTTSRRERSRTPATSIPVKPTTDVTLVARHPRHPRLAEPRLAVVRGRDGGRRRARNYRYTFPTMPTEHTFKAGHQIGDHRRRHEHEPGLGHRQPNNVPVTLDARTSKVTLPIVGGYGRAERRGRVHGRDRRRRRHRAGDPVADPRRPGQFGVFTPGIAKDYEASTERDRDLDRGRRAAERGRPELAEHRPPGQRLVRPAAAAAGRGRANTGTRQQRRLRHLAAEPADWSGPISNDAGHARVHAAGSTRTTRCARGRTARR